MNYLSGKLLYLSGPIEFDTNNFNWRPSVKKELVDRFNVKIFDPFDDPKQSKADELNRAKEQEEFDTVSKIAEEFVHKDLGMVDRCDFLIANLPYHVPTIGTVHEIISALERKIPALLVCTKGKKYLPSWFFGLMKDKHLNYMHGSWESLYEYLKEVNEGKHINDRRWAFVYGKI